MKPLPALAAAAALAVAAPVLSQPAAPPPAAASSPPPAASSTTTGSSAATTTTVAAGERLADVARRALGDAKAAGELRALNALSTDTPAPGTVLRLPGAERARALSALASARNALAAAEPARRAAAQGALDEAEAHLGAARYDSAATSADAAWRAVAGGAERASAFSVEVAKDSGATTVRARRGGPVRVEAQGVARQAKAGEAVHVARGEAPAAPSPLLTAPRPLQPADARVLTLAPDPAGALGPVVLAWAPVDGAGGYVVEVSGPRSVSIRVAAAEARLPPLPAGQYRWSVRAVAGELEGEPSAQRAFALAARGLKLEVKGTQWK